MEDGSAFAQNFTAAERKAAYQGLRVFDRLIELAVPTVDRLVRGRGP